MSTDVPAQRGTDGCSPEYVAAVDQALDVANTPTPAQSLPAGYVIYRLPKPGWSRRAALARGALRTAVRTLVAFAAIAGVGVLGAAVLVDWFAPTAGPSACSQVALPLVVSTAALAVIGLAGAIVGRVSRRRRGDTS